jgi:TolB-like protein/DNA-binding SARP family transcriptional activator
MDVPARSTHKLETFGGLRVAGGAAPPTGAATQRKTLLLLAVLAASASQGASREKLLGLFWPESDPDRARNALKQALHTLRRDLHEPDLVSGGPILRLNAAALASDVQEFENALEEGALERATQLYRGPFLDGLYLDGSPEFERWVDRERERLAQLYRRALEKLAAAAGEAGEHRRAVDWLRRLAAADPLSSRVAVELMAALAAAGDPEAALQHARVHEALVMQELEAPPDSAVSAMVERLRLALRSARAAEPIANPAVTVEPQATAAIVEGESTVANIAGDADAVSGPGGRSARTASPTSTAAAVGSDPRRRVRRIVIAIGAVLALIFGAYGVWTFSDRARAAPVVPSVAVLPFLDIGGDPDDAYFSDGLSEELITALSRVEGLRVAARTSSFALRGARLDMRTIGDTLGVAAVVEGSVRRDGERLRVTAQLIDAASGYHLWSGAYDREVKDVFALQDEIARSIAAVLRPASATSVAIGSAPRTANPEAYDLYLRGTFFRNRLSREAIAKAITYYDRAIALDSGFALAYAGKASAMGPLFYFRHEPLEPGFGQMRAAARRALELDEQSGEAHVAMGIIHFFYEWDWTAAEREFRRATELNPGDPHAFHMRANWLRAMGRVEEAIAMRRRGLELDPLNARTAITLARDYMAAGQYDLAAELYRRGIDLDSLNPLVLGLGPGLPSGLGEVYEQQGQFEAAVEEYLRVAARIGATTDERAELRAAHRAGGMRGFWSRWLAFDERLSSGRPRALRTAAILSRMGEVERAVERLEHAYRERDPGLVYLGTSSDWAGVRDDPRIVALMKRMRLPR